MSLNCIWQEIINSASSVTQTLSTELVDGQRKLIALAVAGASSTSANPLIRQQSNGAIGGLRGEVCAIFVSLLVLQSQQETNFK